MSLPSDTIALVLSDNEAMGIKSLKQPGCHETDHRHENNNVEPERNTLDPKTLRSSFSQRYPLVAGDGATISSEKKRKRGAVPKDVLNIAIKLPKKKK